MAESRNTQIIRDAWDQYQGDHLKFNIKDRPDFYAFFEKGGTDLSKEEMELAGDVSGLDLLDTCCAADARQSLSWANSRGVGHGLRHHGSADRQGHHLRRG